MNPDLPSTTRSPAPASTPPPPAPPPPPPPPPRPETLPNATTPTPGVPTPAAPSPGPSASAPPPPPTRPAAPVEEQPLAEPLPHATAPARTTPPPPPPPPPVIATRRSAMSRIVGAVTMITVVMVLTVVGLVVYGLGTGYRPVVLQTGSMADAAPAGSLVIVGPQNADSIVVGDVIVMETGNELPVTHRIIEIEETSVGRVARTQGDANDSPDPAPYALADDQLVARWIVPGAGAWLERLQEPAIWLALFAFAILIGAALTLRKIWTSPRRGSSSAASGPTPERGPPAASTTTQEPSTPATQAARRWRIGIGVGVIVSLVGVGLVLSLFSSTAQVSTNQFAASDCFSPSVESVQSGTTVHAANGTISETITAVDPTRSFVTATVRSNSDEIAGSSAQVVLSGPTTVDVIRATDAGVPLTVTVDWSVVEYECGVSVQRGIAPGAGIDSVDVTISSVDVGSSFVLLNTLAPAAATDVGPNDLARPLLTSSTNLSIAGDPSAVFSASRSFAWQVVTFDDPDEVEVQTVSSTMTSSDASIDVVLPTTIDRNSTFITTWTTSAATGPSIGSRFVRATLTDGSTVAVDRSATGSTVTVHVQTVTLASGATVQHGIVDLAASVGARTIDIVPVDLTKASVMSTVATPGPVAGGQTDYVADTTVGEASATFVLTAADSVAVTRAATTSDASFGWQVIEWTGPTWWDTDFGYRQRIDVTTTTAAAPGEYTVPLTIDHAALVASGLSLATGDDLRVLRWDGAAWVELDRVLDDTSTWNAADTTIQFRTVDSIAAGTTATYWLYLHNPTATAAPADPEQVFLLVEDFESGTLGDFEDRTDGTTWYSADPWTRRLPITVPSGRVSTDLDDFPLLVSITDADIAARAQADGSDIRFTAADGSTPLAHDLERFDSGTGELVAWVTVPTLASAADTTVYVYYGAGNAPAQELPADVWPATDGGIWHLDRDPSGSAPQFDDVAESNVDGLALGSMTTADLVAGRIGQGIDFDGSDDALSAGRLAVGSNGSFTASAWVRPDALASAATVVATADDATDRQMDVTITAAGEARVRVLLDSGEAVATSPAASVATGTWTHVAGRWDGSSLTVSIDGIVVATTATTGSTLASAPMPVTVGNVPTQDSSFDGVIDEVRVEAVARTDAWLLASHDSQSDPTFVTIGATETGTYFGQGSWAERKPILVDADRVASDLADFVLLIDMTEAPLAAGAQACGCDIVVTAADGVTRLDHVIESYDSMTGTLVTWVSVPVLSSTTDTQLYLYYANPSAVDQQDPTGVFGPEADLQFRG